MMDEEEKLAEDLEATYGAIERAGRHFADHYGLDHYGYEAYIQAGEAIDQMLGIIRNS